MSASLGLCDASQLTSIFSFVDRSADDVLWQGEVRAAPAPAEAEKLVLDKSSLDNATQLTSRSCRLAKEIIFHHYGRQEALLRHHLWRLQTDFGHVVIFPVLRCIRIDI